MVTLLKNIECKDKVFILNLAKELSSKNEVSKKDVLSTARGALRYLTKVEITKKNELLSWIRHYSQEQEEKYSSLLYSEFATSPLNVKRKEVVYPSAENPVDAIG